MLASFYLFLLMAGAIQGIVMGILLWKYKDSPQWQANRFLALMLFFFAYRLLVETLHGMGIGGYDDLFYHLLLEYNWIYGCLIFFYIKTLLKPNFKLSKRDWIHFLPVGLEFLFSNFIKSQNFFWDGSRESLSWAGYYGYILWMHTPFQIVIAISLVLFYANKSRKLFQLSKKDTSQKLKSNAEFRIHWTLVTYIFFSILALTSAAVDYLFWDYAFNPVYKYPTFISMALITYWLGIQGIWYRNEPIFEKIKKPVDNPEILANIITELEKIMATQKPYLNPNLDAAALAEMIDTKSYLLTKAINHQLSKKFNDYINEYRVKEVIERINNDKYSHQTLLSIGLDAGFNSKASFNRVVKKVTGKSPSELKKE